MVEPRRLTELASGPRSIVGGVAGAPLLVALSGGADSAAAAWLAAGSGLSVRALHVHHGAAASDDLADAAVSVAGVLGMPVETVEVRVGEGPSYEAQARALRHEVLADRAGEGEWVVMGHTRDDQVETLLMRLVRGTGIDGLAGMSRDAFPYLRPLLDVSRSEAREMATLAGLPWRDDPSNLDRRHLRNRVRIELLPAIESSFGPGVATSLHRSADVIRRDVELLDELGAGIERQSAAGVVRLAIDQLAQAHPAIAARAIRIGVRDLMPPYPPPARVVDTALEVVAGRIRRSEIGRLTISIEAGWLTLRVSAPG